MKIPKQEYTPEFRKLAVKRVKSGQAISAVAKDCIAKWYVDGTEIMEIRVPSDRAHGLPYINGFRVPINLTINGRKYAAGLRATANNSYVWICPDVKTMDDRPEKLAHVLASAGFKKSDKVFLVTDGNAIEMTAASSS